MTTHGQRFSKLFFYGTHRKEKNVANAKKAEDRLGIIKEIRDSKDGKCRKKRSIFLGKESVGTSEQNRET